MTIKKRRRKSRNQEKIEDFDFGSTTKIVMQLLQNYTMVLLLREWFDLSYLSLYPHIQRYVDVSQNRRQRSFTFFKIKFYFVLTWIFLICLLFIFWTWLAKLAIIGFFSLFFFFTYTVLVLQNVGQSKTLNFAEKDGSHISLQHFWKLSPSNNLI